MFFSVLGLRDPKKNLKKQFSPLYVYPLKLRLQEKFLTQTNLCAPDASGCFTKWSAAPTDILRTPILGVSTASPGNDCTVVPRGSYPVQTRHSDSTGPTLNGVNAWEMDEATAFYEIHLKKMKLCS